MNTTAAKVPQAALLHALKEAGWIDCGRLASKEYATKRHVFAEKGIVARYSKSDLRRMVEGDMEQDGLASDDKKVVSIR
jgi:hypothetical protein